MNLENFRNSAGDVDTDALRQETRKIFDNLSQTLKETHGDVNDQLEEILAELERRNVA